MRGFEMGEIVEHIGSHLGCSCAPVPGFLLTTAMLALKFQIAMRRLLSPCFPAGCLSHMLTILGVLLSPSKLLADEYRCPGIVERQMFSMYQSVVADQLVLDDAGMVAFLHRRGLAFERLSLPVSEGAVLSGYRVSPEPDTHAFPKVLIVQGNAVAVRQLVDFAADLSQRGAEVLVFDYRGYRESTGNSASGSLITDYARIVRSIKTDKSGLDIYAYSFGGIIALEVMREYPELKQIAHSLVIDSTPAEIPFYLFCPGYLDPIRNVGLAPRHSLFIQGTADEVVSPSQSLPLLNEDTPEWSTRRVDLISRFFKLVRSPSSR